MGRGAEATTGLSRYPGEQPDLALTSEIPRPCAAARKLFCTLHVRAQGPHGCRGGAREGRIHAAGDALRAWLSPLAAVGH